MDEYCRGCASLVSVGASTLDCLKGWPDRPCQEKTKKLSVKVMMLPAVIHTPVVIDVGEPHEVRVVQSFHCNYTGADRLWYGKMSEPLAAKLIVGLTPEYIKRIEYLPLEDPLPYHPENGGC
jgi:hypothetical protein